MFWEFEIAHEAEPKFVIDRYGNRILTDGPLKYCLKDKDGNRLSSYFDKIEYLGNYHFAVANYVPHIVTFNKYSRGELIESKTSANDVPLKWGIIKMQKYNINNHVFWGENLVVPYVYDSILPNNDNIITVSYRNNKTFVELDENKGNYGKQIFPCLFTKTNNFDLDYSGFVEVEYNNEIGYIPRNITNNNTDFSLLNKMEVENLLKYFNDDITDLDFDTRYKYMRMTNETPALTRILKK